MTSLSSTPRNPGARITIKDVARAAGVGIKTVSRVVNDEPNVAPATAARVRSAIDALGWEPDARAAGLRRADARTRSLGLLLGSVANPFSAAIHRAIEDIAAPRRVAVFASSLDDDAEREVAAVDAFVRRHVDGLILTCVAPDQSYLAGLVPDGMPIVFIDREPTGIAADVVVSDNYGGALLATRHLLGFGHRRLALLLDRHDLWTARERQRGFFAALAEYGIPAEAGLVVDGLTDEQAATTAATTLLGLAEPPTAIMSGQNLITVGAVHALRGMDRHREVALVGFDDIEFADLLDPGLTVVAQDPSEIGRIAAGRVFEALDAGERLDPHTTTVPVTLIARGSGEIRPGGRA